MKYNCPKLECQAAAKSNPNFTPAVRHGGYFRRSDSRWIIRYFCSNCRSTFSRATFDSRYLQKKRRINPLLLKLLCSEVSQRRAALILRVDRKTVVRRFRFLAEVARGRHGVWMHGNYLGRPIEQIQFDDLETSEHTKLKPVSVAIAVDPVNRKILDFQVNPMPAKGKLARVSRFKYGPRPDGRARGWHRMMRNLKPYVSPTATWTSDENPHYPKCLLRHHPDATHVRIKGGRGAVTGQGELKKLKFDPIFALNHTCAMLRANLNRLMRRTWCTTKSLKGLIDHLSIYVVYHNQVLTPVATIKGAS